MDCVFFFLWLPSRFSFSLVFSSLNMMCQDGLCFLFINSLHSLTLFSLWHGVFLAFGKFSAILSSNISSPHPPLSPDTPLTSTLEFFIVSRALGVLVCFLSLFFLFVFQSGQFLLNYLQVHWFLLHLCQVHWWAWQKHPSSVTMHFASM